MRKKIKKIATHPLISGSFIIFAGGMLGNVFNFLFNLLMSRNLPIAEYGTLISLISLITLFAIPAGCITPTIISVAGGFFAKRENVLVKSFYLTILKPLVLIGILFVVLFSVFSNLVGAFLNINGFTLLFISSLIIPISYLGTINTSFLQAKLSFKAMSLSSIVSAGLKFVLGFVFVLMVHFSIVGALSAYLISTLTPVVIGIFVLREILFQKNIKKVSIPTKNLVSFGIPSAIVVFCLSSFISTDIVLVKHLFSPTQAGLYAGLSLIGKIIFYVTAPVMTVMFPIITNRFSKNENHKNVFLMSVALVAVGALAISVFYFLFPKFTILFFLKRADYLAVSNYLGFFGIFIMLYSLISLFAYYFLSIKQTKISWILAIGAFFQAALIYFLHDSFFEVILISILTMATILLFSIVLYFRPLLFQKIDIE